MFPDMHVLIPSAICVYQNPIFIDTVAELDYLSLITFQAHFVLMQAPSIKAFPWRQTTKMAVFYSTPTILYMTSGMFCRLLCNS